MRVNPLGVPVPEQRCTLALCGTACTCGGRNRSHPTVPALRVEWECANRHCTSWATTVDGSTPYHPCREMNGTMIPLVRRGTRAVHRPIERPDDVGTELVQPITDRRGRLVMAIETHRDDGYDTTVYPPAAGVTRDDAHAARTQTREG